MVGIFLPEIIKIFEAIIAADVLIQGVKAVSAWFTGIKKDIRTTPAYNEKTATADEKRKMNEFLEKKRNEFNNSCKKLENTFQKAMDLVFAALIDSVRKISKDIGISVNIESLQRNFDANRKKLKKNISGMVTRRIAAGDAEFMGILKQKSGDRRSEMIDRYFRKIVREGFKKSEDEFSDIINQAFSLVKDRIDEKIQGKEKSESRYLGELKAMKRELTEKDFNSREKKLVQQKEILDDLIRVLDKTAS